MTDLHAGQVDQASRAAAAILAVHRGYSPKQIGPALDAVLTADVGFRATSRGRWERYAAACIDGRRASTNRRWADYPPPVRHAAYSLASKAEETINRQGLAG